MTATIGVVAQRWAPLEPLLGAYAEVGHTVRRIPGEPPDAQRLAALAEELDALLVVGDRRRSPRSVLPGPVLWRRSGAAIPAAWLPAVGDEDLGAFARSAARLHRRPLAAGPGPVAVLGQWHPQYLRLAARIAELLTQRGASVFRWTSDLVLRADMARGLGAGLAAAIYVGHGRPIGWVGYYGARIHHLQPEPGEPLGLLCSLCCRTASRRRTGLSFAEAVPLKGIAGASLGAVGATFHVDNTRWAVGLCGSLGAGVPTVGDWIVQALPASPRAVAAYRLIGDPLAPMAPAQGALERAAGIPVSD